MAEGNKAAGRVLHEPARATHVHERVLAWRPVDVIEQLPVDPVEIAAAL